MLVTLFEAIMIMIFGASWPFNVVKSWQARTAKGKSPQFLLLIMTGYICGIAAKLLAAGTGNFFNTRLQYLLFFFYCFNLVMVSIDFLLYFRNRRIDCRRGAE